MAALHKDMVTKNGEIDGPTVMVLPLRKLLLPLRRSPKMDDIIHSKRILGRSMCKQPPGKEFVLLV